jgi:hypothetical protein|tara:strand:- start:112 stop:492 length:381 start_codon:yes stop_codon:yes gene_type:complete
LTERIEELESENSKLQDSIVQTEYQKILGTQILGEFNKPHAKVNEEINLSLQFCNQKFYSTYEIFRIHGSGGDKKHELLINSTAGKFDYTFTPKNIADNRLRFVAVFDLDSIEIEIPANIGIKVIE